MNNELKDKPLVSIRFMTYNHSAFIDQALHSIDMQMTNFNFEVVIGDDFSTDGNLDKIKEYQFLNKKISVNILERTVGDAYYMLRKKHGRLHNFVDILNNCRGTYIALLDGDDYWTDPLKLQKQVDFMEGNPEYAICFHRANLLRENGAVSLHPIPNLFREGIFTYSDILRQYNFITTASVLFRKPENFVFPNWFSKIPFGDMGLYLLLSRGKKIKCLNDNMSVYRIHSQGLFQKNSKLEQKRQHLNFYRIIHSSLTNEEKKITALKINGYKNEIACLKFPESRLLRFIYKHYLSISN